jgi:hypothetical protein
LDEREKVIETFVSEHQPCTMEEIVNGLHAKISRNPLYEVVNVMLAKGVLIDEKKNRRDHQIRINEDSLIVTIPPQIELFGTRFLDLAKSTSEEVDILFDKYGTSQDRLKKLRRFESDIIYEVGSAILFYVLDVVSLTSIFVWPRKSQNRETIREVCSIVFPSISDIQLKFYEFLETLDLYYYYYPFYSSTMNIFFRSTGSPLSDIRRYSQYYKAINLLSKFELVADILWSISSDLRKYNIEQQEKEFIQEDWRQAILKLRPLPPRSRYELPFVPEFINTTVSTRTN